MLAIRARNEGMNGIVGQVLNIPVTCHPKLFPQEQYPYSSWEENKDAPIVDATRMQWFWGRSQSIANLDRLSQSQINTFRRQIEMSTIVL